MQQLRISHGASHGASVITAGTVAAAIVLMLAAGIGCIFAKWRKHRNQLEEQQQSHQPQQQQLLLEHAQTTTSSQHAASPRSECAYIPAATSAGDAVITVLSSSFDFTGAAGIVQGLSMRNSTTTSSGHSSSSSGTSITSNKRNGNGLLFLRSSAAAFAAAAADGARDAPGSGAFPALDQDAPGSGALPALDVLHSSAASSGCDGRACSVNNPAGWGAHFVHAVIVGTLDRCQAASIQLGALAGCGSWSRVFCGSYGAQQVAVKVINHTGNSIEQVSETIQHMLEFQHPNVVQAYEYVTWAAPCAPDCPLPQQRNSQHSSSKDSASLVQPSSSCCYEPPVAEGLQHSCCFDPAEQLQLEFSCWTAAADSTAAAVATAAAATSPSSSSGQQKQQPSDRQAAAAGSACLPGSSSTSLPGQQHNSSCRCSSNLGSSGQLGAYTAASKRSVGSSLCETWILEEFCCAGTLQQAALNHSVHGFFEDNIPQMGVILEQLLCVAQGMQYLHSCNVVHGDLKAGNVMLTYAASAASGSGSDVPDRLDRQAAAGSARGSLVEDSAAAVMMQLVAKVADFGLSRVVNAGANHLAPHTLGSITHLSPEVMRTGRLSKPADVFAFGILMWEVMMAATPWEGRMMGDIINLTMVEQARLEFSPCVPKGYGYLAESCWQESPRDRPSFAQLVPLLERLRDEADVLQQEANAAWGEVMGYWTSDID